MTMKGVLDEIRCAACETTVKYLPYVPKNATTLYIIPHVCAKPGRKESARLMIEDALADTPVLATSAVTSLEDL